jgi:hypothetical protein
VSERSPSFKCRALKIRTLARIARLSVDLQHDVFQDAIRVASGAPPSDRVELLAGLLPRLPPAMRGEVVKWIVAGLKRRQGRREEHLECGSLARIARRLAREGLHEEALIAAGGVRDASKGDHVLAELALRFASSGQTDPSLEAAKGIKDRDCRASVRVQIAGHLPEPRRKELIETTLEEVRSAGASNYPNALATGLFLRLTENERGAALQRLLRTAEEDRGRPRRGVQNTEGLAALAPRLAGWGYPDEAVRAARLIGRPVRRARILLDVAARLSGDRRVEVASEAIESVRSSALKTASSYEEYRSEHDRYIRLGIDYQPCTLVANHAAHTGFTDLALDAVRSHERESDKVEAIRLLTPLLSLHSIREAIEIMAACEFWGDPLERDRRSKSQVLSDLLVRLARSGCPIEALERANAIRLMHRVNAGNEFESYLAVSAAARELTSRPPAELSQIWSKVLDRAEHADQRTVLLEMRAYAPILAAAGGEEALTDVIRAVREIRRLWGS